MQLLPTELLQTSSLLVALYQSDLHTTQPSTVSLKLELGEPMAMPQAVPRKKRPAGHAILHGQPTGFAQEHFAAWVSCIFVLHECEVTLCVTTQS